MDWLLNKATGNSKKPPDKSPETNGVKETKPYLQDWFLEGTAVDINVTDIVYLPKLLSRDEWLASSTVAFFQHTSLMYGSLIQNCTTFTCPTMSAPGGTQYQLLDEKGRGKGMSLSAPQYIDTVLSQCNEIILDDNCFPTKYGGKFPPSFEQIIRKIQRWIFHVLAHIYHVHSRSLFELDLHKHYNLVFLHMVAFNRHFALLEDDDLVVLADLIEALDSLGRFGPKNKRVSVASQGSDSSGGGLTLPAMERS